MKEDTNRQKAWSLDTELYADKDEETGLWCVFGNNSGFAYRNAMSKEQARDYAKELNGNKEFDKQHDF